MDWVVVKKRTKSRTRRGKEEEEVRKSCRTVQIFVKVDGSKVITIDVELTDSVSDIVKRITNTA